MVKDQLKRKEEHKKLLAAERLVNQHKKTIEELKATNKQKEEQLQYTKDCLKDHQKFSDFL